MLNRRRMMLNTEREIALPEGYTRLNYIENTNTAYIEVGVISKNGERVQMTFEKTGGTTDACILGDCTSGGSDTRLPWITGSNKLMVGVGYKNINSYYDIQSNVKYTTNIAVNSDNVKCTIDGMEVINAQGEFNATGGAKGFALFARRKSGGFVNQHFIGRIYACKIWQETLVRNFIPCQRNEDGKIGMYDVVENKFYTSANSNKFIGG